MMRKQNTACIYFTGQVGALQGKLYHCDGAWLRYNCLKWEHHSAQLMPCPAPPQQHTLPWSTEDLG